MRRLLISGVLFLLSANTVSGCLVTQACTADFRFGVNVSVRNARTGAEISNATVVITEGTSFRETLSTSGLPGSYSGAGERAGTYTLTVTAQGFVSPPPRTIVVTEDECHVRPVSVPVDLTPQ